MSKTKKKTAPSKGNKTVKKTKKVVYRGGGFKEHGDLPIVEVSPEDYASYTSRLAPILDIQSKSYYQEDMIDFVIRTSEGYGGVVTRDSYGNVYVTKGDAEAYPCVVAHLDTVHEFVKGYKVFIEDDIAWAYSTDRRDLTGVGGDDKCGIFLALEMLRNNKVVKAAFFKDEEVGCRGSGEADAVFFENVTFAMQGDRRGYNDVTETICGFKVMTDEFIDAAEGIFAKYNKDYVSGGLTDVYEIAYSGVCPTSTFNTSCGYYRPHTDREYIVLTELFLTAYMFQEIIDHLYSPEIFFKRPASEKKNRYRYNGRGNGSGWWDSENWRPSRKQKQLPKTTQTRFFEEEEFDSSATDYKQFRFVDASFRPVEAENQAKRELYTWMPATKLWINESGHKNYYLPAPAWEEGVIQDERKVLAQLKKLTPNEVLSWLNAVRIDKRMKSYRWLLKGGCYLSFNPSEIDQWVEGITCPHCKSELDEDYTFLDSLSATYQSYCPECGELSFIPDVIGKDKQGKPILYYPKE